MISSPAFVPPAHFELLPSTMDFSINATNVLQKFLPKLEIKQAHKTKKLTRDSLCGYYRIETKSGLLFFAKVKSSERAKLEVQAAEISTVLFHRGARTLPLQASPVKLPDDTQIFLYPWVDGIFFDDSDVQIQSLGRELARLHNAFSTLSANGSCINTIELWTERLNLIPHTSFAAEYEANLRLVENIFSRNSRGMAHNDLHRANVLFTKQGEVAAIVDFEDSAGVWSSVIVDLSAVIERFCILPTFNSEKITIFLTNYLHTLKEEINLHPSDIVQVGLGRCFYALAILHSSSDQGHPGWKSEVAKFEMLIKHWKNWEKPLREIRLPF